MTFTPQMRSYTYNNEVRDALVSVKFDGIQEAIQAFEGAIAELKQALASGLYSEAELVMTDAKANYVPVGQPPEDATPGTLRNSGFVNEPEWQGNEVTVTLGFGGAAEEYALRQHEELSYKHTVGQAKYLERPMLNAATGIDDRLAAKIQALSGLNTA
jgi:hypothetical protein